MRPDGKLATPIAVAIGAVLGLAAAVGGVTAWNAIRGAKSRAGELRQAAATVDLFRGGPDANRCLLLVPAGPDANGEPALARALYPGEDPPRELASLLVANVADGDDWTLDLAATPLRGRRGDGGAWERLTPLGPSAGAALTGADRVRLRALGVAESPLVVAAGSLRKVLFALPPSARFAEFSGVQWGSMELSRDSIDLERVRRFREDPAAATSGR